MSLVWKFQGHRFFGYGFFSVFALMLYAYLFLAFAPALPAYGQSQTSKALGAPERPRPGTTDEERAEKTALLNLAEQVYIQALAAMHIQQDCQIMNQTEFNALRWHTKEIRKYLMQEKGLSALSALQLQARQMSAPELPKDKAKAARGLARCNKELMLELTGILEQAEYAAASVGGQSFDDRAAALNHITTTLKKAARLKGAFVQCEAIKPSDAFTVKKLAELDKNAMVLSAIAMVNGAKTTLFGKLASLQQQTAHAERWKSECKLHRLQAMNKQLESVISLYKEP